MIKFENVEGPVSALATVEVERGGKRTIAFAGAVGEGEEAWRAIVPGGAGIVTKDGSRRLGRRLPS